MTKKNIMPVVVLTLISVIVAALLALTHSLTKDTIAQNEEKKITESLRSVIPDGEFEKLTDLENLPSTVTAVYKEKGNKGHAVTLKTQGYASEISITVGIDPQGKILKAIVTSEQESHGKAGMDNYTDRFTGVESEKVGEVDLFSGASVSSGAIRNAIKDATVAVSNIGKDSSLILNEALTEIIPNGKFTEVKDLEDLPSTVTAVYKENSGLGHVLFLKTRGYAGDILINVGVAPDGKIIKAVITAQSETHGQSGMDSYTDSFTGVEAENVGKVELFTNATVSSTAIRNAIKDAVIALGYVNDLPFAPSERTEDEVYGEALKISGSASLEDITPENTSGAVKKLYKTNSGSYVAYIITVAAYGGGLETEGFIVMSKDQKIEKIEMPTWKVGHDVTPDESFVNQFVGMGPDVSSATLITNATGTSSNFRDAVGAALDAIPMPFSPSKRTEEEVYNKALAISEATALTDITPLDAPSVLKRLYKTDNSLFVAYTVTVAAYGGGLETEGFIVINTDKKVTKIEMPTWTVGHDVTPDESFVNQFVGKDEAGAAGAELVAGATTTASNFRGAVKAALNAIPPRILLPSTRTETEVYNKALEISGARSIEDITPDNAPLTLRRLYKASNNLYVAYTVTVAAYGGGLETEGFIVIDSDRKIVKIEMPTWKVGHDVEPEKDFITQFIGKDEVGAKGAELVTGATGTASNFRGAVWTAIAAIPEEVPEDTTLWRALGISAIAVSLVAFVAITVINRKRRAGK